MFTIDFPKKSFSDAQVRVLKSVLPPAPQMAEIQNEEESQEADLEDFGSLDSLESKFTQFLNR